MVIYAMLGLMPGDPFDLLIASNPSVTSQDVVRLKKVYGLDQPIHIRYLKWLNQVVIKRDFGFSRVYKQPTLEIMEGRISNTLKLMVTAFVISLIFAIPIGIYSATHHYSVLDYIFSIGAFTGISVPSFWLGIMLIMIFSEKWGLFPAGGMGTIGVHYWGDKVRYYVLPVLSISLQTTGAWVRYLRSSMLEVIRQDYIRTARAKGLDEETILYKHAFKNALIPLITILALSLPGLVSGATITEMVFAWPGMGRLLLESVMSTDYYVAMIAFLFLAALTLLSNFVADLLYVIVDPRIRIRGKHG